MATHQQKKLEARRRATLVGLCVVLAFEKRSAFALQLFDLCSAGVPCRGMVRAPALRALDARHTMRCTPTPASRTRASPVTLLCLCREAPASHLFVGTRNFPHRRCAAATRRPRRRFSSPQRDRLDRPHPDRALTARLDAARAGRTSRCNGCNGCRRCRGGAAASSPARRGSWAGGLFAKLGRQQSFRASAVKRASSSRSRRSRRRRRR